jgi:hypothetical protein
MVELDAISRHPEGLLDGHVRLSLLAVTGVDRQRALVIESGHSNTDFQ